MTSHKSHNTIVSNIERLRRAFPLQARIESADAATCDAYAIVLTAWLQDGVAPQPDIIPKRSLESLASMDAVIITESGLGCYPFSADDTGITVAYGVHRVHAMCAIDALAIPFLVRSAATIRSRCRECGMLLTMGTDNVGIVTGADPAGIQVEYRKLAEQHSECCNDLCPGIAFLCASCAAGDGENRMTLEEAAAVGRLFFYFQIPCMNRTWSESK
jgi:hypothetical protein